MRITTKAIMTGYNRNLNLALNNWNAAQNKVLTQRNFNTIAENPADANRAFNLRRQFRTNNSQLEMTKQTQALIDQVTSSAMQISDIMTNTINPDVIKAVNGTNSLDERKAYAESLRGMQESIVLAANSQISGRYIFGGASTKEPPFELSEDGLSLTYRGMDVTGNIDSWTCPVCGYGYPILTDGNGNLLNASENGVYTDANGNTVLTMDKATGKFTDANGNEVIPTPDGTYGNTGLKDPTPMDALDALANETLYVDLGFGLEQTAAGETVSTSAFNTATPGLNMLGYGVDDNGVVNNVVVLLGQVAAELEKEPFSEESYGVLMDKYNDCINQITDYEANLGTKQQFLEGTVSRLEQYNDTINDRVISIEQVDMPEAISTYTWMGYAYNAALKVGTDIVSNSLLDFMR